MSYSFAVTGATKSDAQDKVFIELTKVCDQQKIHGIDAEAVNNAARAFIEMLENDASKDVHVSVNGYLIWLGTDTENRITQARVSISAALVQKTELKS